MHIRWHVMVFMTTLCIINLLKWQHATLRQLLVTVQTPPYKLNLFQFAVFQHTCIYRTSRVTWRGAGVPLQYAYEHPLHPACIPHTSWWPVVMDKWSSSMVAGHYLKRVELIIISLTIYQAGTYPLSRGQAAIFVRGRYWFRAGCLYWKQ